MRLPLLVCLFGLLSGCGQTPSTPDQTAANPELRAAFEAYAADPITLDEACTAGAPGELAPLCELLGTATGNLVEQCGGFADEQACAAFGGNVYALVSGCYTYGEAQFGEPARQFCKIADTFVSAAAAYCRQTPGAPAEFCALFSGALISQAMIERYQASPTHTAHRLQRELSAAAPLRHTLYLATHNSFNATEANTPPTLSGSDANQRYSLVDQLRMDVRGLEIDVHWVPAPADGGFRATVCHGNAFHFGCTTEKSLREELTELRGWLDANPGEVIIIDLESNLNEPLDEPLGADRYALAAADIWATIGDLLVLPEIDSPRACGQGQPLELSIQQIRQAGKQVIIYGACDYVHAGQSLMFDRTDTHLQRGSGSYIGISAPDNCIYTLDEIDAHWVRFYEDGTLLGALTGAQRQARADEVREMARCNINMPSVDHLQPFDGRLQAFLWSWGEDEPAAIAGAAVAVHGPDGQFHAQDAASAPGTLACLRADEAVIRDGALNPQRWLIAQDACPAGSRFAVPRNGLDNEVLKRAKTAAGIDTLTLNLQRTATGPWTIGN